MSEIEKAREARTDQEWAREALITAIEGFTRLIAREEIEAAKGYKPQPGDRDFDLPSTTPAPASPPAVEAPAAGDVRNDPAYAAGAEAMFAAIRDSLDDALHSNVADLVRTSLQVAFARSGPLPKSGAPAAGDGASGISLAKFLEKHQEAINKWKAANGYVLDPDTTALACQLAEALRDLSSWMMSAPVSIRTKALEALTEARKRGLIE